MRIKATMFVDTEEDYSEALRLELGAAVERIDEGAHYSVFMVANPPGPVVAAGPNRHVNWGGPTKMIARLLTTYVMKSVRDCPEVENGHGQCACGLYIRDIILELLERPKHAPHEACCPRYDPSPKEEACLETTTTK